MKNESILVISDSHFPFNHGDIIAFLSALKDKYKFDRVVHIGDEVDYHAISFHDSDPDLMSPGDELRTCIERLKPLYKMFPNVDVLESNHGSLVYRKQKSNGLPRSVFKSYREILEAPRGWKWHDELIIRLPNNESCVFVHGKTSNVMALSRSLSSNAVCGHFHEKFAINYWSNSKRNFWQMNVGCLIENKSLAFAYNKLNLYSPVIGVGIIIDSLPYLIPMRLNKAGRWTGRL